ASQSFFKELSRLNKENLINIILKKCILDNILVSEELKVFVENKNDKVLGKVNNSYTATTNNESADTELVGLKGELKTMKMQFDYSMEIIKTLKSTVSDKELMFNLLTKDKQMETMNDKAGDVAVTNTNNSYKGNLTQGKKQNIVSTENHAGTHIQPDKPSETQQENSEKVVKKTLTRKPQDLL
ncbi:hypothetical protein HHI36_006029, partial [Cryptolaemus montrouzieri]